MRAWIRVLDAPGCYERTAQVERKSALQGSRLVRTVGPCAQRRVALMPRAIATARDALWNNWCESAARFERPAKQALALTSLAQPDSYTSGGGGRESGKVLYIKLSQRLVATRRN